ncbi:MAG: homoserine kinase [Dehalococcoidia bacterium]|nr:homoserine kinase [Dehalococcoidia bacterium]
MSTGTHRFVVVVPATSANLGPGFDCMGLTLSLYNTVSVEPAERADMTIEGEGADTLPHGKDNVLYAAFASVFDHLGRPVPAVRLTCANNIPLARGLGSSAAAVVGGLVAANVFAGKPLSDDDLLKLAVAAEGHADNVAPALLGGCRIVVRDGDEYIAAPVSVQPGLKAVLFIPDFPMSTREARSILSPRVSRGDAIFNISRAALLTASLASGSWSYLRVATQDRLHQPARQAMFPAMPRLFAAALDAGALGAFLSGGGSTVLAFAHGHEKAIATALAQEAQRAGVSGRTHVAELTSHGAQARAQRPLRGAASQQLSLAAHKDT